jgi:hypothetical protein
MATDTATTTERTKVPPADGSGAPTLLAENSLPARVSAKRALYETGFELAGVRLQDFAEALFVAADASATAAQRPRTSGAAAASSRDPG